MTALARDPARVRREGQSAMAAGKWTTATTMLRQYLAIHPGDGKVWTDLATACEKAGEGDGALEAQRRAATVFEADGSSEKAVAAWSKVARLAPDDGWAEMRLGENFRAMSRRADARAHFLKAEAIYRRAGRTFEVGQVRKRLTELEEDGLGPTSSAGSDDRPTGPAGADGVGREPARAAEAQVPGTGSDVLPSDEAAAFVDDRMDDARLMRRYGLFERAITSIGEILARFPGEREAKTLLVDTLRDAGEHDRAQRLQDELDAALPLSGRIVPSPERHIKASEVAPEVDADPEAPPVLTLEERGLGPADGDDAAFGEDGGRLGALVPDGDGEDFEAESLLGPAEPVRSQTTSGRREFVSYDDLLDSLEPVASPTEGQALPGIASGALRTPVRQRIVLATEDADERTRLDLALALISMGLEDEAVAALEELAKGEELRFEASLELAESLVRRGLAREAIRWYETALSTPGRGIEGDHRVRYRLALACEEAGEIVRAFDLFLGLYTEDARFEDVSERVHRLKPMLHS